MMNRLKALTLLRLFSNHRITEHEDYFIIYDVWYDSEKKRLKEFCNDCELKYSYIGGDNYKIY